MDASPPPVLGNPGNPCQPAGRPQIHPARGWLLVIIGIGLSVSMPYLAWVIYWAAHPIGNAGAPARWHGSRQFTRTVFELFGAIFAFGLVSIGAGAYVLATRRISRVLGGIMIAIVVVIFILGAQITSAPAGN